MAHSLINKLLVTIRTFCWVITGDVERLLILMVYGRALQAAADRLFAWTTLLRLRGDDGQKEVVSQSWPLLPVPTGVIPRLLLHRGNAQLKQLHGDDVCLCLYRSLDRGINRKGRKPCIQYSLAFKAVTLEGFSEPIDWTRSDKFYPWRWKYAIGDLWEEMVCVCTSQYVEKVFVPYVLHIFLHLNFITGVRLNKKTQNAIFKPRFN